MENLTPFEKTSDLGQRLAQCFALDEALRNLDLAKQDKNLSDEAKAEVAISEAILIEALIVLAGNNVIEA